MVLVEAVLIMAVVGIVLVVIVREGIAALGPSRSERAELARLQVLVDDLKELAWDHREIDPDLATLLLAKIRESERGRPPLT